MITDTREALAALPPLPKKRRAMLCTKCGFSGPTEEEATPRGAPCQKCSYIAFVEEVGYSDDEMQAYARAALATQPAQPDEAQMKAPQDGMQFWLWKNGDHFLAFTHLYPCFTPGGDPMVLGEPVGRALFRRSHDRSCRGNATQNELPKARSLTDELMDCVDRLGSEWREVDPRVWDHLRVYMPAQPVAGALTEPCKHKNLHAGNDQTWCKDCGVITYASDGSSVGRAGDDDRAKAAWRKANSLAWSCASEARDGVGPFAGKKCEAWCHSGSCPVALRGIAPKAAQESKHEH